MPHSRFSPTGLNCPEIGFLLNYVSNDSLTIELSSYQVIKFCFKRLFRYFHCSQPSFHEQDICQKWQYKNTKASLENSCLIFMLHFDATYLCYIWLLHFDITFGYYIWMLHLDITLASVILSPPHHEIGSSRITLWNYFPIELLLKRSKEFVQACLNFPTWTQDKEGVADKKIIKKTFQLEVDWWMLLIQKYFWYI